MTDVRTASELSNSNLAAELSRIQGLGGWPARIVKEASSRLTSIDESPVIDNVVPLPSHRDGEIPPLIALLIALVFTFAVLYFGWHVACWLHRGMH